MGACSYLTERIWHTSAQLRSLPTAPWVLCSPLGALQSLGCSASPWVLRSPLGALHPLGCSAAPWMLCIPKFKLSWWCSVHSILASRSIWKRTAHELRTDSLSLIPKLIVPSTQQLFLTRVKILCTTILVVLFFLIHKLLDNSLPLQSAYL